MEDGVLKSEDIETALRVIKYLHDNPELNQKSQLISSLRHVCKQWVQPDWKKEKQKQNREQNVKDSKEALTVAGIRQGRSEKKQRALKEILPKMWHPQDNMLRMTLEQSLHSESLLKNEHEQLDDELGNKTKQSTENNVVDRESHEEKETPEDTSKTNTSEQLEGDAQSNINIKVQLACYVCKTYTSQVHHFYDQMCTTCGEFNLLKRLQTANLLGKVALVTGGRIKIGYEVTLKLLRCGASVIVTTRFPKDALRRYSLEDDFETWKDRIHIYALDMRLLGKVEQFSNYILSKYDRLDIIIHNAAQTIRRPPIFYKSTVEAELKPVSPQLEYILHHNQPLMLSTSQPVSRPTSQSQSISTVSSEQSNTIAEFSPNFNQLSPAELTQVPLIPEDSINSELLFPPNQYDADLQQVDLRSNNSWILHLNEVSSVELVEVHVVNALAPFCMTKILKPLMMKHGEVCTKSEHQDPKYTE
eukprot:TRINITY_DN1412_c0_g1_i2.p1 TRINITY_DN1412_c0_g1~~TRINITY_DN1412_c0_g1_i2.p1  ORF type:complete len:474 (+),score=83.72 TRINITY_DN1412_c0_g1_i2:69-1490(+)